MYVTVKCTVISVQFSHVLTCCAASGVVVDLLGIPVSQVAMGRTHTCVLTQDGRIFTFGGNQFGQCGRNFVAPKEEDAIG